MTLRSEENRLAVGPEHVLEGAADLEQRAILARTLENERHRVRAAARRLAQILERLVAGLLVALCPKLFETRGLILLYRLADLEQRNRELRFLRHEFVHADDHAAVLLDLPLLAGGGLVDLLLQPAFLESLHHAPDAVDLREQRFGFLLQLIGERLDVI